jgi:hypothetical protein
VPPGRWLDVLFGNRYARRLAIAAACSIALHEILAGLMPPLIPRATDSREVVQHVAITRIAHLATPTPHPTPTPRTLHTLVVAQTQTAGVSARAEVIRRMGAPRVKAPKVLHATPVPEPVSTTGQGAGEGNASDAGSLGTGGTGSGAGNQGNGAGGGGAPCGAADFEARGRAVFNQDTGYYERSGIVAIVHYADGASERVPLDWTWRYKNEDDDPFSNGSAPMYFQPPPLDQQAGESAAVQYIMKYSNANGSTRLNDQCPNIPQPSAGPGRQRSLVR